MIQPSFSVKKVEEKSNYSKYVLEPLEQGFGHTLGNALRRYLLTNMIGAAITKVKIEGVRHQFTTLEGMKEDVVEFILNLKKVRIIYSGDKEVKLTVNSKGQKEIKAQDIKTPAEIKIINKNLTIANLADKKSAMNAVLWVNSGYGYSPAEERKSSSLGVIPIDAVFSPVLQVNYKVEATRVGRITDYDRLILEIWTDGTIKGREALKQAAKALTLYFKQIYKPVIVEEVKEEKETENNEALKLTVEELNLPTRIANALRRGGYPNVESLTKIKKEELNKVKNLGVKSIDVIEERLKEKELDFINEA
ncbi:DNA-directed RNA polymerase subunit alpha [Candidatus Beckwithbacteria bacterium RBG_13_35_6]|uniref:DNA-directed RNA polymerase subunit alpha n=1 Tax=Candidatus Beckwithbacteria bacterium RBG_13_35_6 TaxID=1797456 RepID=A0A1F5DHA9_9BACT|nr:MAG: DNA-directed RNA polymerase subunit alpha [Candidatus Beckwithbacteria bacterium RBG_13_35_6]